MGPEAECVDSGRWQIFYKGSSQILLTLRAMAFLNTSSPLLMGTSSQSPEVESGRSRMWLPGSLAEPWFSLCPLFARLSNGDVGTCLCISWFIKDQPESSVRTSSIVSTGRAGKQPDGCSIPTSAVEFTHKVTVTQETEETCPFPMLSPCGTRCVNVRVSCLLVHTVPGRQR